MDCSTPDAATPTFGEGARVCLKARVRRELAARLGRLRNFHEDPALVDRWTRVVEPFVRRFPPDLRRWILSLASLWVLWRLVGRSKGWKLSAFDRFGVVAPGLLALCLAVFFAAKRFERLPRFVRRRPQVALQSLWVVLLLLLWATAGNTPPRSRPLGFAVAILPFLLWRLGYLLKSGQRGKAAGTSFVDHLFYLLPAWGGSDTPYGKGWDALSRAEAGDAARFAKAQLAGLKCLVLALLWKASLEGMERYVLAPTGSGAGSMHAGAFNLGIPGLDQLVRARGSTPLALAWLAIYVDLVRSVLSMAAKGHVYVGVLRLLGFDALRNTYKPLLATSVAEFWNRYHYYFKELLAEFFFFPAYMRTRGPIWRRTLLAVFAAAFVGNLWYHVLDRQDALLNGRLGSIAADFAPRVVYCFLLATGIWVSMMREQARRRADAAPDGLLARWRRRAGVWTFFALIHVWATPAANPGTLERTRFVLSLFAPRLGAIRPQASAPRPTPTCAPGFRPVGEEDVDCGAFGRCCKPVSDDRRRTVVPGAQPARGSDGRGGRSPVSARFAPAAAPSRGTARRPTPPGRSRVRVSGSGARADRSPRAPPCARDGHPCRSARRRRRRGGRCPCAGRRSGRDRGSGRGLGSPRRAGTSPLGPQV